MNSLLCVDINPINVLFPSPTPNFIPFRPDRSNFYEKLKIRILLYQLSFFLEVTIINILTVSIATLARTLVNENFKCLFYQKQQ